MCGAQGDVDELLEMILSSSTHLELFGIGRDARMIASLDPDARTVVTHGSVAGRMYRARVVIERGGLATKVNFM